MGGVIAGFSSCPGPRSRLNSNCLSMHSVRTGVGLRGSAGRVRGARGVK
jgi:hypothetical protein